SSRRDLADISFLYKLINNYIDAPYLLKHISFNILAYNNGTTPTFYLPSHSTNYLKKTPLFLEA
ncbi:Reverse transcriptase domain-containing protein, partial [Aphis craccivora]